MACQQASSAFTLYPVFFSAYLRAFVLLHLKLAPHLHTPPQHRLSVSSRFHRMRALKSNKSTTSLSVSALARGGALRALQSRRTKTTPMRTGDDLEVGVAHISIGLRSICLGVPLPVHLVDVRRRKKNEALASLQQTSSGRGCAERICSQGLSISQQDAGTLSSCAPARLQPMRLSKAQLHPTACLLRYQPLASCRLPAHTTRTP